MTTDDFTALPESQLERLTILIEECDQTIHAASSILCHGYDNINAGASPATNRQHLELELGHIVHAIRLLTESKDIAWAPISNSSDNNFCDVQLYLHYPGAADLQSEQSTLQSPIPESAFLFPPPPDQEEPALPLQSEAQKDWLIRTNSLLANRP